MCYNIQCSQTAAVAQSVERILGKDEVGSSNLPSSSKKGVLQKSRFAARPFSLMLHVLRIRSLINNQNTHKNAHKRGKRGKLGAPHENGFRQKLSKHHIEHCTAGKAERKAQRSGAKHPKRVA